MKSSNISFSEFCDAFGNTYRDNFSYAGKRALYDYFENTEEETGEEIEMDIVAICCEYTEYESMKELKKAYSNIKDIGELCGKTTVIEIPDSEAFIIKNY